MKVYYYCSYTGSPVGYILGGLTYEPAQRSHYELSGQNIPALIRKCFESGLVRKALGVLPGTSQYFLLIKKLTAKGISGDFPADYYLNLALVSDSEQEFQDWLRPDSDENGPAADLIRDSMELNRTSDFGFTVKPDKLAQLAKSSFASLLHDSGLDLGKINGTTLYVEQGNSQATDEKLRETLGLHDADCSFVPLAKEAKWVCYRKKKRSFHTVIAALLAAILALFLIGITAKQM